MLVRAVHVSAALYVLKAPSRAADRFKHDEGVSSTRAKAMAMNVEEVAYAVLGLMHEAPPATVLIVHDDGRVTAQLPGFADFAGVDRRRHPIATFVVSRVPPLHAEIVERLASGLRKRGIHA
jgi:hypothetical protein